MSREKEMGVIYGTSNDADKEIYVKAFEYVQLIGSLFLLVSYLRIIKYEKCNTSVGS